MATDDFVAQVRVSAPFPWRKIIQPNGIVLVIDTNNKEVPLFTLVDFACFISGVMNKPQKEAV